MKWNGLRLKLRPPQSLDSQPYITAPTEIVALLDESDARFDLHFDKPSSSTTTQCKLRVGQIQAHERHAHAPIRLPGDLMYSHIASYVDCDDEIKSFRRLRVADRVLPLVSCHNKTMSCAVWGEMDATGEMKALLHLESLDVYLRLSSILSLIPLMKPLNEKSNTSEYTSVEKTSSPSQHSGEKKIPMCLARSSGLLRVFLPCEPIIGSRNKDHQETLMLSAQFIMKSRDSEISKLKSNDPLFQDMIMNWRDSVKSTLGEIRRDSNYARSVFESVVTDNASSSPSSSDDDVFKVLENSNRHVLALRLSIESGSLASGKNWKERSLALVRGLFSYSLTQRTHSCHLHRYLSGQLYPLDNETKRTCL
jgi:hypothetical protein